MIPTPNNTSATIYKGGYIVGEEINTYYFCDELARLTQERDKKKEKFQLELSNNVERGNILNFKGFKEKELLVFDHKDLQYENFLTKCFRLINGSSIEDKNKKSLVKSFQILNTFTNDEYIMVCKNALNMFFALKYIDVINENNESTLEDKNFFDDFLKKSDLFFINTCVNGYDIYYSDNLNLESSIKKIQTDLENYKLLHIINNADNLTKCKYSHLYNNLN
jgi:alkyl hydroperoxide reductase subunit AhpF